MKSTSQNCRIHKPANKRMIALALLIFFISFSLLSEVFILTHSDHVHDHNGIAGSCAACVQIQNTETVLKLLGTAAVGGFALLAGYYAAAAPVRAIYFNIAVLTPIAARTRMNN